MMDSKLPKSYSQIKREARIENQGLRSFGGKLENFIDNKDRHFNQRMLSAYLKGAIQFQFGQSWKKNHLGNLQLLPDWHDVLFTDKTIDPNKLDALLAKGYCDPGKVFGGSKISKHNLRKIFEKK